ncbi:sensor histidine kinase [Pseudonocardia sp. HH130630-07]|uniref:sensor histidine kinase n=1 Tax=Pseudonocardia sp. HH130630-07 TaxID=1690815 RepID=UPI0018D2E55D|nr:HAMP domain-containing sensor histidine kinase [Pseudonocardia sp. HH130630-07]
MRTTLLATTVVAVALGAAAAVLVGVLSASLTATVQDEAARWARATAVEIQRSPAGAAVPGVRVVTDPAQSPGEPAAGYVSRSEPVTLPSGPVVVEARASLQPVQVALDTLWSILLPGIPALLVLVGGLTWLTVGRTLAPVAAIRRELAAITTTDLHRRVPVPAGGDEIAALASTTNATLDRLEHAVDRHRRFVADAAHELRSPLAVLRARLEIAPTRAALADVEHVSRLADDLLLLARLDAGEPPERGPVELGQVVAEEAARPRGRAGVEVRLRVEPGPVVPGSAPQLRRLTANLVDNAVRHATREVEVRLSGNGEAATLDVLDDGAGVPDADRETVFDRFTRLDEARSRDAGGSGLGLAIAREIAERHGGSLVVVPGAGRGHLRAVLPLGG